MKLITTILCGPDIDATLERAIASITDHVDAVVLIDTTPAAPRAVLGQLAPEHCIIATWPWISDFGAARNEALAVAAEEGADWAITTDADEWWSNADQIRAACAAARPEDEAVFFTSDVEHGSYWQPRAIRIPCMKRWDGLVHEGLSVAGAKVRGPMFHETLKNDEQIRAKAARDAEALRVMVAERPNEPRWLYYLGESYVGLRDWPQALEAFMACSNMRGWHEERALACLRAGEIMTTALHDHDGAVEVFAHGLAAHAGISELAYMAALASLRAGKKGQALYWARLAQVHGENRADDGMALAHRLLPVRPDIFTGPKRIVETVLLPPPIFDDPDPEPTPLVFSSDI